MNQPTRAQLEAANQIAETVLNKLNSNGKIHYPTVISACATLAGTFYFRSFNFVHLKAEPGAFVLSEEANNSFPVLAQYLSAALEMLKVKLDGSKINSSIDDQHKPLLHITKMQILLERELIKIANSNELNKTETAISCSLATAQIIHMTQSVLDPHISFDIAIQGFIQGTKTMPAVLN